MLAVGLNSLAVTEITPSRASLTPIATVVRVPSPELSVNATPAPRTAPPKLKADVEMLEPPLVLIVVAPTNVIAVSASPIVTGPFALTVPARRIALGTVAVNPPVNVTISPEESPSCSEPALLNIKASATVFEAPVIDKS